MSKGGFGLTVVNVTHHALLLNLGAILKERKKSSPQCELNAQVASIHPVNAQLTCVSLRHNLLLSY